MNFKIVMFSISFMNLELLMACYHIFYLELVEHFTILYMFYA